MSDPLAHLTHLAPAARDDFTRARAAVARASAADAASALRAALGPGSEVLALATCERVEFVVWTDAETPRLADRAAAVLGADGPPLRWRARRRVAAARHLFRLAAGLESRIVGEREILGQVRRDLNDARTAGTIGPRLEAVLAATLRAARAARARTDLGLQDLSAASLAADHLAAAPIPIRHVALLGSGAVAQACIRHLLARNPGTRFTAFARHLDTARARLAGSPAAVAPLDTLPSALAAEAPAERLDALIAATASPTILVTPATLAPSRGPLAMVDLGMPPNIDPRVAQSPGVSLLSLHDLPLDAAPARRAVADAETLIERHLESFIHRERAPRPCSAGALTFAEVPR
jgi:glutamyl-tRNA reductase